MILLRGLRVQLTKSLVFSLEDCIHSRLPPIASTLQPTAKRQVQTRTIRKYFIFFSRKFSLHPLLNAGVNVALFLTWSAHYTANYFYHKQVPTQSGLRDHEPLNQVFCACMLLPLLASPIHFGKRYDSPAQSRATNFRSCFTSLHASNVNIDPTYSV